jgi:hypothetical protein
MPTRIIRASLLDSERYHGVDIRARLAYIEILLCADDYGLVPLNDLYLTRHTTAFAGVDRKIIGQVIESLADHDLIRIYRTDDGGLFGFIPRFRNNPRAKKPAWPTPPPGFAFQEINELVEKTHSRCAARAKQMHSICSARASETETETETETEVNPCVANATLVETPEKAPGDFDLTQPQQISKPNGVPYARILALYHEILPELPRCLKLTDARKAQIRQRWIGGDMDTEAEWVAYFQKIRQSKFLMGKSPPSNGHKVFRADLEWLTRDGNCAKVWEGRYDG